MEYSFAYKARLTQQTDIRQIKYQGEIIRGACPEWRFFAALRMAGRITQDDMWERPRRRGKVDHWTF
jgi:hypothetical protein